MLKWLCDEFLQIVGLFPWKFQDFFILGFMDNLEQNYPSKFIKNAHSRSRPTLGSGARESSLLLSSSDNFMNSAVWETL